LYEFFDGGGASYGCSAKFHYQHIKVIVLFHLFFKPASGLHIRYAAVSRGLFSLRAFATIK
jgi:hypothetical protein